MAAICFSACAGTEDAGKAGKGNKGGAQAGAGGQGGQTKVEAGGRGGSANAGQGGQGEGNPGGAGGKTDTGQGGSGGAMMAAGMAGTTTTKGGAGGTNATTMMPGAMQPEKVWIDNDYTMNGGRPVLQNPLKNWRSPVNYLQGMMHQRLVIKSNPTTQPVYYEIVFWWDLVTTNHTPYACLPGAMMTKTGTYTCSKAVPTLIVQGADRIDISAKEAQANGDRTSKELTSPHAPMNVHYTVVLVPKGQEFSGWDKYPVK